MKMQLRNDTVPEKPLQTAITSFLQQSALSFAKDKSQTVALPHHSAALAIYNFLSRCSWTLINYSSSELGNSL